MNITHDVAGHRFHVTLPEGQGELVYLVRGPQRLEFQHTGVDDALRGHGVGDALVHAAFEYARRSHDLVIPTCPYVREWLGRHPEYQDLVSTDPDDVARHDTAR